MKNIKLLFSLGAVALLVACSDPRPPEEIVAERAQARWDALVARDFKTALEYYSPGFREQVDVKMYAADMVRKPIKWTSATVRKVECAPPKCETTTEIEYTATGAPGNLAGLKSRTFLKGTWLEIDGKWWYSARG